MSKKQRRRLNQLHHYMAEHIWRAMRAAILLIAVLVWIGQDGFQLTDLIVLGLCLMAHLLEQFHGKVCRFIEHIMGWKEDFKEWE